MGIKVVFCWSGISGYMAACWRALHKLSMVEVFVIAFQASTETSFSEKLMQKIPCRLLNLQERQDADLITQLVIEQRPDILVISGWFHKPYRQLTGISKLRNTTFVMGMDTPWLGAWKQYLAAWILRPYLRHIDQVVVTGERSWQYARRLGIDPAHITRGLYGIDYAAWLPLGNRRQQSQWPRSFLFVGRYTYVKAVDILVKAYRHYRTQVSDPWPLICCGQGELASLLDREPGIENCGFIQPSEMQDIWQGAGVFLLPSRFDPWPLALVEAAAVGLPIICTDACGSAVEVVRHGYNGLILPENDSNALADALIKTHFNYDTLAVWGERSQQMAAPYAADIWAKRWLELILRLESSMGKKREQIN